MFNSAKKAAVSALAACSLVIGSQAAADIILDTSSSQYLGVIVDGIPSNPANEIVYINTLIAQALGSGPTVVDGESYTRTSNTCGGGACPTALLAGGTTTTGVNSVNVGTGGFQYILGKYDAGQAGAFVWYIGGQTGVITIPDSIGTCGGNGCGLSHLSLYNPGGIPPNEVPEPASLALLGLGMAAVAFIRRRKPH
jgi:hypothetical protein